MEKHQVLCHFDDSVGPMEQLFAESGITTREFVAKINNSLAKRDQNPNDTPLQYKASRPSSNQNEFRPRIWKLDKITFVQPAVKQEEH